MVCTVLLSVRAWQVHHLLLHCLIGLNKIDKQQCNFMNSRNTHRMNFVKYYQYYQSTVYAFCKCISGSKMFLWKFSLTKLFAET